MIPDTLFDALSCGARSAVELAWNDAHANALANKRRPDEIDHVYAMTKTGIQEIGANWSPVLRRHGIALRVTGVFCHQTPKAHYIHPVGGPKSPELGDLLVVHEHRNMLPSGQIETSRRAVLVQAKMARDGVPQSGKVDQYQEYLYENWPDFELKGRGPNRVGFLAGLRNFRPCPNGGRYGLIESTWHRHRKCLHMMFPYCTFPWTCSEPAKPIRTAGGEDLGAFIANMLYETRWPRGRLSAIPNKPLALSGGTPNNHFDVTVEELLTLTAMKTMRFRNKPHVKGHRGVPGFACTQVAHGAIGLLPTIGKGFSSSDGAGVPPGESGDLDDGDGISILLFETGSEGELRYEGR